MHINFAQHKAFKLDFKTLFDLKKLKDLKLDRLVMVIIVSVYLLFMIIFGVSQKLRLDHYIEKNAEISREITQLRKQITIKEDTGVSVKDMGAAYKSFKSRVKWSDVLKKFISSIGYGVWLSSIDASTEQGQIKAVGEAPDQFAVASVISGLEKTGLFSDVSLESSDMKGEEKDISFTVICKL